MSRLSRLKLIKNWNVLDDFYGYEVKGINIKFNKTNDELEILFQRRKK